MKYRLIIAGLVACATTVPATAQSVKMRPGLWQFSSVMKSESGAVEKTMKAAQAQMASFTPEQRKQVEAMLAQRGVGMTGNSTVSKMCITPEAAERGDVLLTESRTCSQKVLSQSGNTMKVSFSCATEPPSKGTGELTVLSPTSIKTKAAFNTDMDGKPDKVSIASDGVWLSAECGGIPPVGTAR